MHRFFLPLIILILSISCDQEIELEPPENLLDEASYLDVYIELKLFDAMIQAVDTVQNQDSLRMELFKYYGVSEENFKESHAYYQSQSALHQIRLDSATSRLARIIEEMDSDFANQTNQPESNSRENRP